ncbi:MAG: IclR family transcriptional regulator [Bryobacterales bacterium]|nr:IclR family transcriptional regulator [Bryobacterales bacterium]
MSNSLQTADRVLQILGAFDGNAREMSITRIADRLGVHKSTASRLATTLVQRGFLERQQRTLRLGPEVNRLGLLALASTDLAALSAEAMQWLSAETGESVHLAVLEGGEALNVAQADGPAIVGIGNWVGRKTKLHCAANGKVLLAFSGQPVRGPLTAFTARTITSVKLLRAELQKVREQGWASNAGELEEGLNAVAVPVFDASGGCRAALSVSGPAYRVSPDRFSFLAGSCEQAARLIGFRLGHGKPSLKGEKAG